MASTDSGESTICSGLWPPECTEGLGPPGVTEASPYPPYCTRATVVSLPPRQPRRIPCFRPFPLCFRVASHYTGLFPPFPCFHR